MPTDRERIVTSLAMDRSHVRLVVNDTPHGRWWTGDVITRWGIVAVYTQEGLTMYNFAHRGRHWTITERRQRTKRGLGIIAGRIARNITEGRTP